MLLDIQDDFYSFLTYGQHYSFSLTDVNNVHLGEDSSAFKLEFSFITVFINQASGKSAGPKITIEFRSRPKKKQFETTPNVFATNR